MSRFANYRSALAVKKKDEQTTDFCRCTWLRNQTSTIVWPMQTASTSRHFPLLAETSAAAAAAAASVVLVCQGRFGTTKLRRCRS